MSNLDDFFKKRDKKKKSAKSKFPTLDTDELAKNLEATAIKGEDDTDFQDNNNNLTGNTNNLVVNDNLDEEWKPYEDENKDLSGLKITFLKQVEDENNDYLGVTDENEKKSACPWGSVNSTSAQNKQFDENQQEDLPNETAKQTALSDSTNQITSADIQKSSSSLQIASGAASDSAADKSDSSNTTSSTTTTSTGGAYVPPALRRQQVTDTSKPAASTTESTSSKYVPPAMRNSSSNNNNSAIPPTSVNFRRPNKSQPNINDTMEFPTLDAAGTESTNTNDKMTSNGAGEKFEMAKKGARIEPKAEGNMINLANKFTALSSNN